MADQKVVVRICLLYELKIASKAATFDAILNWNYN